MGIPPLKFPRCLKYKFPQSGYSRISAIRRSDKFVNFRDVAMGDAGIYKFPASLSTIFELHTSFICHIGRAVELLSRKQLRRFISRAQTPRTPA